MINAYYDGVYMNEGEIGIGLDDRAYFFADSVYEVLLGRGSAVYQLDEHLARLMRSCELSMISYPIGIEDKIKTLLRGVESEIFSVYIQVSRSGYPRLHAPSDFGKSRLLILFEGQELNNELKVVRAITDTDMRHGYCDIKTTSLFANVISSIKASQEGCEEAILVRDGVVTEGAKSSVFAYKDGIVYTHPLDSHILPGITRKNTIDHLFKIGVEVREEKFPRELLLKADEVFITSTTKLLRRVSSIDGAGVNRRDGALSRRLYTMLYDDFISQTSQMRPV